MGTPSPRSSSTTSAETRTLPLAVAVRAVTSLPDTSTMRAAPDSSRWVKPSVMPLLSPVQEEHRHLVALVDAGDALGQHDQRVGLGQAGDQVRARAADRGDPHSPGAERDLRAHQLLLAPHRLQRRGHGAGDEPSPDGRLAR